MSFAAEAVAPSEGAAPQDTERRNYRVAIHLAMFAAGILVPILLIVTFMLINTARLMRDDALHDAHLIAQHLNETIDVELEKAIAVDETLAAALALDDAKYAGFEAQARDVAKRLGMNITVRDASGSKSSTPICRLEVHCRPVMKAHRRSIALRRSGIQW